MVKGRPGNAELLQCAPDRQMRLLDQLDDLELLGGGVSHSPSPPSAIVLFLSSRNSRACSATTSFSSCASRRSSLTSSVVAALAVSPPLAGLEEFLRPAVIEAFGDPLAPAQFGNAVFAAKSIEYDPNLILSRIVFARRSPNLSDDLFGRRLRCPGFLSHLRSLIGYDEPEILLSSSH